MYYYKVLINIKYKNEFYILRIINLIKYLYFKF